MVEYHVCVLSGVYAYLECVFRESADFGMGRKDADMHLVVVGTR